MTVLTKLLHQFLPRRDRSSNQLDLIFYGTIGIYQYLQNVLLRSTNIGNDQELNQSNPTSKTQKRSTHTQTEKHSRNAHLGVHHYLLNLNNILSIIRYIHAYRQLIIRTDGKHSAYMKVISGSTVNYFLVYKMK